MKHYNLLSMLVLGIVLFGSYGCAKDQTPAEYDDAQAAKAAAQNLPAVADWVGPVTGADNSTVGTIQLHFQTDFVNINASDNTAAKTAVLDGQVQLANVPNSEAQISGATFTPDSDDSNNGTITATITAKDANGNSETLSLSATISGNQMTGQLQADADTPLFFVATKGASASSQNLVINSKRAQFENGSYFSTLSPVETSADLCNLITPTTTPPQECVGPCPSPQPTQPPVATCASNLQMSVIESNSSGSVNFFNIFTNQPTVQVDIAYYAPITPGATNSPAAQLAYSHLQFPAVTWDQDSSKLTSTMTTAATTSRLDCSTAATSKGQGWNCNITNGGVSLPNVLFAPGQINTASH